MYHSVVDRCSNKERSSYINSCVVSLRDLFTHQLVDMIAIDIHKGNERFSLILRRYQIKFHSIDDPCSKVMNDNTKQLIDHLNQINSRDPTCTEFFKEWMEKMDLPTEVSQSIVISDFSCSLMYWFPSNKLSSDSQSRKLAKILQEKSIDKESVLINEQSQFLSSGKDFSVSQMKSFPCKRLHLQIMCEDDQYGQKNDQEETDDGADSERFHQRVW